MLIFVFFDSFILLPKRGVVGIANWFEFGGIASNVMSISGHGKGF